MNERIPQGMYDAFWDEDGKGGPSRMRAALLWLADNVSDEMWGTFDDEYARIWEKEWVKGEFNSLVKKAGKKAFAAALRQAAGGEG